jgi:hypothetical protein
MDTSARGDARQLLTSMMSSSTDDTMARDRYNFLKSSYENRLKSLVGQLKDTLLRVQGDAAVHTLAADVSTADFVSVR